MSRPQLLSGLRERDTSGFLVSVPVAQDRKLRSWCVQVYVRPRPEGSLPARAVMPVSAQRHLGPGWRPKHYDTTSADGRAVRDLQRGGLGHLLAEMRSEYVAEVEPSRGQVDEMLIARGLHEVGAIEVFVIGAVTALDAVIVLFASHGIAAQGTVERLEETLLQSSDVVRIVSTER